MRRGGKRALLNAFGGALVLASLALSRTEAAAMALDPGRCDAAKASALVGKPAPSDAEARTAAGAAKVRRIKPGQPVTLDFSASRLTLEIVDGKVVSARCG